MSVESPSFFQSAKIATSSIPKIREGNITLDEAKEVANALTVIVQKTPVTLMSAALDGCGLLSKFYPSKESKPLQLSDPRFSFAVKGILSYMKETTPQIAKRFILDQITSHGTLRGYPMAGHHKRLETEAKLGIKIPWAIVVDITSNCNITPPCEGCLAGRYPETEGPSLEELNSLVGEAKELGTSAIVFSGGEPLLRELDILEIIRRHPKLNYAVFTNGTLIGDGTAKRFLETETNTVFFVHAQGNKESTDRHMGQGVYERTARGMELLNNAGFPFGFSITVNRHNFDEVTNKGYTDSLRKAGCRFGIYFPYMPVGRNPNPELMLTSSQTEKLKKVTQNLRRKGLLVFSPEDLMSQDSGCIAGTGHIVVTASGNLQPCVFIHSSDINVYEKGSLAEALTISKVISGCQKAQEQSRACLIRERSELLSDILTRAQATSTESHP